MRFTAEMNAPDPSTVIFVLISLTTQCISMEDNHTGLSTGCGKTDNMAMLPGVMSELKDFPLKGTLSVTYTSNNATTFALKYGYPSVALYGKEAANSIICLKSEDTHRRVLLNITLYYCPPGFVHTENLGTCDCPIKVKYPAIVCNQLQYSTSIFVGFCISRESSNSTLLIARCAVANHLIMPFLPIPYNNETGETSFCQNFHRQGRLCSECIKHHGITVFSDTYKCIPCREFRIQNLIIYLAIELLPTTAFFFAILFFHIGITTSATNGFIFFAQMITTPLEVLFLTYGFKLYIPTNKFLAGVMADLIINPYCIWNLTFFRMFHHDICLHPHLKVVHVIALRYISAIYPLFLVAITYTVIELKARNIRLVTWLWRLLCFPCIRWRRIWKAKTSVIDAFASCILLSYTKLVLVSLMYISSSSVQGSNERVLSFDTSVHFLGSEHRPYLIVAIIVLLTFGAFPPIVLTCYQFKPFKVCLSCLHLKGAGFQRFVDAFQGYYKDGTNGTLDCHFFAGVYFIFRCIFLVIFAISSSFPISFTEIVITSFVFLLLFAIVQPYKERLYNIVDSLMIFLFGLVTTLQMYCYEYLQQTLKMNNLFLLYYILLYVPLVYMIVYVAVWFYKKWKQRHTCVHTPIDREPDFYRESVLDERATESKGARGVSFLARNTPTHTEVSISRQSSEDNNCKYRDMERSDESLEKRGSREEVESDDDEVVVRHKPYSENKCLVQQLEPVMRYGSIQ